MISKSLDYVGHEIGWKGSFIVVVYLVTWNLNREGKKNYNASRDAFIKNLELLENIGDPGLESVRFVSTKKDAHELAEYLHRTMDGNDRLFVTKLNRGEFNGWLHPDANKWINDRVPI